MGAGHSGSSGREHEARPPGVFSHPWGTGTIPYGERKDAWERCYGIGVVGLGREEEVHHGDTESTEKACSINRSGSAGLLRESRRCASRFDLIRERSP